MVLATLSPRRSSSSSRFARAACIAAGCLMLVGMFAANAWSPGRMFAGGAVGAWYDPSDSDTLFQDAAMTTPVTTAGDPVGAVLDKSGNSFHWTQATTTARFLYLLDGSGRPYLAGDGVDDMLKGAGLYTLLLPHYMAAASALSSTGILLSAGFNSNNAHSLQRQVSGFRGRALFGGSSYISPAAPSADDSAVHVVDSLFKAGATDIGVDGVVASASTAATGTESIADATIGITGASPANNNGSPIAFYGGLILQADPGADRARLQAWLARKSGVVLA